MDGFKISMAAARVNAGKSQEEMAEMLGVSRHTILNWETGKSAPSTPNFFKFCEICAIDPSLIFLRHT